MSQTRQYEMKDSGVEWIGEIPKEWETKRIKCLALSPNSLFLDGDWINSPDISDSGIRYFTTGNVGQGFFKEQGNGYITTETFDRLGCTMVHAGDLIISRLNEPIGRACIIPAHYEDCIVAVDNVILRPDAKYCKKFLMYCMSSDRYAEYTALLARGTTMHRISRTQLGNMPLPIPPLPEQEAIAAYLDEKCAVIDGLIAEAKASIEEYKAWKASVIFEAVTKGLDPNAEMKDSGVDIIGKMPSSWSLIRQRFLCKTTTGDHDTQDATPDGEYPFYVRSPNVERSNTYTFEGEGILMAGDGVGAGKVFHHATGRFAIHQRVYCFYDFKKIKPRFYYYFMSNLFAAEIDKGSAKSTVASVRLPMLKDFPLCVPSQEEQEAILDYLDAKCAAIDGIIAEKESLISELETYKKSLIFETVTGKRRIC